MSSSASNTAAADAAGQDTETKASTVSAKIELFAKLIDPFAEGTKFTAINDVIAAAEGNSSAAESENAAVDAVNPGEGTKVEDPAVKLEAKEVRLPFTLISSYITSLRLCALAKAIQRPGATQVIKFATGLRKKYHLTFTDFTLPIKCKSRLIPT